MLQRSLQERYHPMPQCSLQGGLLSYVTTQSSRRVTMLQDGLLSCVTMQSPRRVTVLYHSAVSKAGYCPMPQCSLQGGLLSYATAKSPSQVNVL